MITLLLTAALATTPLTPPKTVSVGSVLLVAGEAGLAAGGGRPWLGRSAELASVTSVFQRFDLMVSDVPLLGPASVMLIEAQQQTEGWQVRVALSAASLSLQSLGCAVLAYELDAPEEDEGTVTTLRPTRIAFKLLEGQHGGVVTISGVTF